jgi:glycosyltransferase involved in cell wall biosynthesis
MVVLHVAGTSGPSTDLGRDLDWLTEAGRLEVVVPGPGPAADAFAPAPVTELRYSAVTLPGGPWGAARAVRRTLREVRTVRAHLRAARPALVVVATSTLPAVVLAARLERLPAVVYAAEVVAAPQRGGRSRARAGALLLALTRRLAAAVVACSATVARQFGDRGGAVPVAYPPIADAYTGGDGGEFRRRHGIPDGAPCVVAVGNLTHGRGQDLLVEALPAIRRSHPTAHCAIVGVPLPRDKDVAFAEGLPRLARELGVGGAVRLTGYVSRVADAYAAADVVVSPARVPESFGRAACEALAAGRPVVAAHVGAVPEVLRHGKTALLVPPENPDAVAVAVTRLLDDPGAARRLAEAGRRDVLDRFAPERSSDVFRDVIERVAG